MFSRYFGSIVGTSAQVPAEAAPPTLPPKAKVGLEMLGQARQERKRYQNGMPGTSIDFAIRSYEDGVTVLLESIKAEQFASEGQKVELRGIAHACLAEAEGLKEQRKALSEARATLAPQRHRSAPTPGGSAAGGGRGASSRPGNAAAPVSRAEGTPRGGAAAAAAAPAAAKIGSGNGERPSVRWNEVAGLENAKAALQEAAVLPIRFPSLFTGERKPWRGILLYGPPGTGKSRLAQAVATEVDASYFAVTSSDLVSKWVGESEKQVRLLFEQAAASRPSIIFIDEVDALVSARTDGENDTTRRLKNELLVRMSEAAEGVLVLGATNVPWGLDPAVRRRFERRIHIPLPDADARYELLRIHLGATPHELSEREMRRLSQQADSLSGADVSVVVRDALMEPVRMLQQATHFRQEADGAWAMCGASDRGAQRMGLMQVPAQKLRTPPVTHAHMERAMRAARPSVGTEDLRRHEQFTAEFGAGN